MKFAAIILSVLVLSLTSIPCCLFDACEEEEKQEQNSHSTESDCESCSPFLNCGSCHNVVFVQELQHLPAVSVDDFSVNISQYQIPLHQEYISVIWQPPKMS